jgi:hypothetical protein
MMPHSSLHAWLARFAPGLLSWRRVVAAAVIAAAAWIVWGSAVRSVFTPPPKSVLQLTETFNDGAVTAPQRVDATGFKPCPNGWCLDPGTSGTLVYQVVPAQDVATLVLWSMLPPGGSNRVSVSVDGGARYQVLSQNASYTASRLDLGGGARRGRTVLLKFDASNPSPNQVLALDQLMLDSRAVPGPELITHRTILLMFVSFGMAVVVLCRRWPLALSTVLILALAASLRYEGAVAFINTALDPDAENYLALAAIMRLFTETGFFSAQFDFREPGFVLAIHLFTGLFGSSDFGLRLLTVILSTASVWGVMRVARGVWGPTAGQVAGLVLAVNQRLIFESARGLRLELELVLCMAFFGLAFVRNWSRWPGPVLAMSLVGAMLAMTRSTYVPVVLVLGTYAVYRRAGLKAAVGGALILVAVVAAFVTPHRYNLYKLHGDPYYDTSIYARWNANFEFAGRPGYPTWEELQKDSFVGPPITYKQYMFGLHTPRELLEGTVRGYWKLYRKMEVCPWRVTNETVCGIINAVFQVLAAAGWAIALWRRNYLWIPFSFLVFEFPVSFLYDRGLVEPYRHSYTALPLLLFSAVLTVVTLYDVIVARRRAHAAAIEVTA